MKKNCSNLIYPLLIILLVGFLAFKNYVQGTFLSGWDTLHPEFNFHLYLNRIFSGAWQEHQGVGAVAAQSHIAEITRIIFPYLLSLVLPASLVRFSFMFLMLALGGVGIYFLTKYILSISLEKFVKQAAFLSSIFYILNLGTLQQFYNPLEMFPVHFATLPWLFLYAIKFLREGKKKNLIWFSIVTIFSASISHTATLFYVYFGILALYIFTSIILSKGRVKRGLTLIFVTLLLNLFWLEPNIYYVTRESQTVTNSQISRTFLTEAFLQSRAFGNIKDLALLRNFPFNWREFDFSKNAFTDQMSPWINHLGKPYVTSIGYAFFALAMLGIIIASIRKSKYTLAFVPAFLVCVFFWINENPPFTALFTYLRQSIPVFAEALRFPFTKFSIVLICCLSVFLAFSMQFILKLFSKIKLHILLVPAIVLALVYYMLPAMSGYFIDPAMKVKIPNEYQEAFVWFEKQDHNSRVATLPMQSFWNWIYYDWEYQGAGFTWFGIPQPTLNREFDRWGLYNEDFYFQASNALYSGNKEAFYNVLKKYQVKYLFLDESVINAGGSSEILYIDQIKSMVDNSGGLIQENAKFNFLTVYQTNFDIGNKYVSAPETYSEINTDMTYAKVDPLFATYGNYLEKGNVSFPFVNLDKRGNMAISIQEDPATASASLKFENKTTRDQIYLTTSNAIKSNLKINNGFEAAHNCDLNGVGSVYRDIIQDGTLYRATDGGVSCDYINYPDLPYSQAYVLHIAGENKEGRSLKIYLIDYATARADLEELLPEGKFDETYFIYPSILNGAGYTLDFETRSYGSVASENLISKVEFYPVDYAYLAGYRSGAFGVPEVIQNNLQIKSVKKYGTWGYRVETMGEGLMSLGQGYEEGWIAFRVTNGKPQLLNHLKLNSWENAWEVPDSGTFYIFFWPQALEWGGMLFGAVTLLILVFKKKQNTL